MSKKSLRDKFRDTGVNEPLSVDISGKQLELDVYAKDVTTFMLIGQKFNKGKIDDEEMSKLEEVIRKILYRSYLPYYNEAIDKEPELSGHKEKEQEEEKEFIEKLLAKHFIDFFTGITEALGWHDGVDKNQFMDKKKEASGSES